MTLRDATLKDLDALVALEQRCFDLDRISRRNFRHLLTKAHAATLVAERDGALLGYGMILLHRTTAAARLYSFAVDPAARRQGLGRRLLQAIEERARAAGAAELRLEVRPDNQAAIASYQAAGYRTFGTYTDFYEDHTDALRMEKRLAGGRRTALARVPYYAQTLPFTCGAASLMMAMKALAPEGQAPERRRELRLWREATLIYMTSGHGGCDPFGLAVAARRRGFAAEVYVTDEERLFIDSVRDPTKKDVIRLVLQDFRAQAREAKVPVHRRGLSAADAMRHLAAGEIPIVLVSSYALTGEKAPHWVVLTGFDERFLYFHDPDPPESGEGSKLDCINVPVPHAAFERIARYGATRLKAAVVLGAPARNQAKSQG